MIRAVFVDLDGTLDDRDSVMPYWEMAVENALTVDQLSEILPWCLNR